MIEEINSADAPYPPEDEEQAYEAPPPPPRPSPLPWVLVGLCVVALVAVGVYGRSQLERANERATTAEKANEDLSARLARTEEERKAAVRRATDLSEKGDEATSLGNQLKEKDAELSRLQQTQETLVAKLHAIARSNKKVGRQIEAVLPKAAPLPGLKGGKSKGKRRRS